MRINLTIRGTERYERATVLVVPVDELWLERKCPVRPGDVLDVATQVRKTGEQGKARMAERIAASKPMSVSDWVYAYETMTVCTEIIDHPIVVSVTAKMLEQLDEDDLDAMGVKSNGFIGRPVMFQSDWTADHGSWQPEKWVWVIGIEKGAT